MNTTNRLVAIQLLIMNFFQDLSYSSRQEKKLTFYNSACLAFSAIFLMFTEMMPTVLTFPAEIDILSIYIDIYLHTIKGKIQSSILG